MDDLIHVIRTQYSVFIGYVKSNKRYNECSCFLTSKLSCILLLPCRKSSTNKDLGGLSDVRTLISMSLGQLKCGG